MIKTFAIAAATALPLAFGAAVLTAAPVEAAPYYGGSYHHAKKHCWWTHKRVRVWTNYGPRWVWRNVRVCGWR